MVEKICILGLGYIGLPTASMFASHGYNVFGVDSNEEIVRTMAEGRIHIREPGLKTLVNAALKSRRLEVGTAAVRADVFMICVPTPIDEQSKEPDLDFVKQAAEDITPCLEKGNLVILESTVPPGTTMNLVVPILEKSGFKAGNDIHVAYCPERVLPGKILTELVKNDRIVGGLNETSAHLARNLYRAFVEGEIHTTDITTAEMVKLMENTYRDVNIALANEFLKVSEIVGVDAWRAIYLANRHPRVNIHSPGPGVGGHCIAVDPWFLVKANREATELIRTARQTNDGMPDFVASLIEGELEGIEDAVVTVFGVAYKGNVGDARQSPALTIIPILLERGYEVRIYDPLVSEFPHELLPLEKAVTGSDCIVILADHREFNNLDLVTVHSLMRHKKVIDMKKCLSAQWKDVGFEIRILGNG